MSKRNYSPVGPHEVLEDLLAELRRGKFLGVIRYIALRVRKDVIRWSMAVIKMELGIPTPLLTEDRGILENVVLPYFADNGAFNRILFVGCNYYTWHYKRIFRNKEYWTIEPQILRAMFGAKRHVVGFMRQIDQYFDEGSLDVIICNGVVGVGLNDPREIEESFRKCFFCLREGGVLVIGWDDTKERVFLPFEKCASLKQFQPFVFSPLGKSQYTTHTQYRHTFTFYVKPKLEG